LNIVVLIGRLTKDPEVRYTQDGMAIASFTLAVDRPVAAGKEKQADFPRVTVFGKTAEACEKYLAKGRMTAVRGSIRTGSYKNKDGNTVYTTEVVASDIKFVDWGDKKKGKGAGGEPPQNGGDAAPDEDDEDLPF
jgi:single-strand DNA-binding protein